MAVLGLALVLRLLPALPLPSVDLPDLPLPSVDLPDLPLPAVDLPSPAWVRAILEAKEIWLPVLAGIVLAVREWRKRRRPPAGRPRAAADPASREAA